MNIIDVHTALCGGVLSPAVCESIGSVRYGISDSYLRIRGSVNPSAVAAYIPQIVLRCRGSIAVAGVYRRLLKRCLMAINQCSGDCNVVVTPGGGTNELLVACLWLQIASQLGLGMSSQYKYSAELVSVCFPLVARVSQYIEQMLKCYNFAYKHAVITVLASFAEACLSIPRQLLRSMDSKNCVSMLHQWMLRGYHNNHVYGFVYSDIDTSSVIRCVCYFNTSMF